MRFNSSALRRTSFTDRPRTEAVSSIVSACSIAWRRSNKSIADHGFSALARFDFAIAHQLPTDPTANDSEAPFCQKNWSAWGKPVPATSHLGADQQLSRCCGLRAAIGRTHHHSGHLDFPLLLLSPLLHFMPVKIRTSSTTT